MMPKKPKEALFNGKPLSYWKHMAHELVVDSLVRASVNFQSTNVFTSLPQKIAAERLMALALAENPVLVRKSLEERDRCLKGLNLFITHFAAASPKPKPKKKR